MEKVQVDTVCNDGDRDGPAYILADERFVVRTAQDLESGASGDALFEGPQLGVVFEIEDSVFGREAQTLKLHELILEIDAGAIENEWYLPMIRKEELGQHEIENMRDGKRDKFDVAAVRKVWKAERRRSRKQEPVIDD